MHIITEQDRLMAEGTLRETLGSIRYANQLLYVENMLNCTVPLLKLIEQKYVAAVTDEEWVYFVENFTDDFERSCKSWEKIYQQLGLQYVPYGVDAPVTAPTGPGHTS